MTADLANDRFKLGGYSAVGVEIKCGGAASASLLHEHVAARGLSDSLRDAPSVLGVFSGSIGVENLEMAQLTQRFKAAFGSPNFFSVESIFFISSPILLRALMSEYADTTGLPFLLVGLGMLVSGLTAKD